MAHLKLPTSIKPACIRHTGAMQMSATAGDRRISRAARYVERCEKHNAAVPGQDRGDRSDKQDRQKASDAIKRTRKRALSVICEQVSTVLICRGVSRMQQQVAQKSAKPPQLGPVSTKCVSHPVSEYGACTQTDTAHLETGSTRTLFLQLKLHLHIPCADTEGIIGEGAARRQNEDVKR